MIIIRELKKEWISLVHIPNIKKDPLGSKIGAGGIVLVSENCQNPLLDYWQFKVLALRFNLLSQISLRRTFTRDVLGHSVTRRTCQNPLLDYWQFKVLALRFNLLSQISLRRTFTRDVLGHSVTRRTCQNPLEPLQSFTLWGSLPPGY